MRPEQVKILLYGVGVLISVALYLVYLASARKRGKRKARPRAHLRGREGAAHGPITLRIAKANYGEHQRTHDPAQTPKTNAPIQSHITTYGLQNA